MENDITVTISDPEQIQRWDEWSAKAHPNGWIILTESPTKRITIFYDHVIAVERNYVDPHAF